MWLSLSQPDTRPMHIILFITVALSWGFTWYAIHLQLGLTPDIVSIFWRFAAAAAIIWLGLAATGNVKAAPLRQHAWFAALGLTLFSGNFVCLYGAEHKIPSGLVAVIFSMASVFNAANQWGFRGVRPSLRVLGGAITGILGVTFLFGNQLSTGGPEHYVQGIALALAGTYLFSLGNFISARASANGVTLSNAIARGMSWGTILLALVILARGNSFVPIVTGPYLAGLLYLAVIGSVVGFLAYLSLVARAGATNAAYVTVVSPVVALSVSSALEHYSWTSYSAIGVALIIFGNIILFSKIRLPRWCAGD